MRPSTAVADRRAIPGFERRGSEGRPMSAASKTRPLRRSMSGSVLLVKSELSMLLPARLTMKTLNPKAQQQVKSLVQPIHRINVFPLFDALQKSQQDSQHFSALLRTASSLNLRTLRTYSRLFATTQSAEVSKASKRTNIYRKLTTEEKEKTVNFVSALRTSFNLKVKEAAAMSTSVQGLHKKTKSTAERVVRDRVKRKGGRSIEVRIQAPGRMSTESGDGATRESVRTQMSRSVVVEDPLKYTFVSQYCDQLAQHPVSDPKKPKSPVVHFSSQ